MVSGALQIWDIHTKSGTDTGVVALNQGMSWFPDGRRLAYVSPGSSGELPRVFILDVDTGKRTPLHFGSHPVISTDGTSMLLAAGDEEVLLDIATGQTRKVSWRGNWLGPIALIRNNLLLYLGLPTAGAIPGYTQHNSPLVGPKPMGTVKLGDLRSGEFQTVIPYVDPRDKFGFGISKECPWSTLFYSKSACNHQGT